MSPGVVRFVAPPPAEGVGQAFASVGLTARRYSLHFWLAGSVGGPQAHYGVKGGHATQLEPWVFRQHRRTAGKNLWKIVRKNKPRNATPVTN
jgi:hypothetical protein